MLTSTFVTSLFIGMVAAAPNPAFQFKVTGCDVSKAVPNLPSGQTTLAVSSGEKPFTIGLGIGIQNYTCSSTGTFTSVGAVAELLDITCAHGTPLFNPLEAAAYSLFNADKSVTVDDVISALGSSFPVLGQHYFATNPFTGSGVSPVFDFRAASRKGDPTAFVLANKTGDIAAPSGSQDVDWLELTGAQGNLAKHVYRLDTKAGQPPASCTPGSPLISVKYAAKYWFFK